MMMYNEKHMVNIHPFSPLSIHTRVHTVAMCVMDMLKICYKVPFDNPTSELITNIFYICINIPNVEKM